MQDNAQLLIEALANKLGVTVEYLWGVLLHQAPISGCIDLIICTIFIVTSIITFRVTLRKTRCPKETLTDNYPRAEWENEYAALAWTITSLLILISTMLTLGSVQDIVSAFANPEYWALKHLIK